MDWLLNRPIAHRGLHRGKEIPENSMRAFETAIAHDHPIELDIQPLADGAIAVFHDSTLDRLTGQPGLIAEQTSDTIRSFRLFQTDQTIPLLSEALAFINGRVPVLIEIKNEGDVGALESALLAIVSTYQGAFAIQAFNPLSLEFFKQKAPHIRRGQLSGNFKGEDLAWYKKLLLSNLLLNGKSDPNFIAYDFQALPSFAPTLNRRLFSTPLIAWTVRNDVDRLKAESYADNYIFDAY
ncbi:MAG: glycerophosphodiester phosphodiesterase family protein [Leptolyngbyaceae bacterium]|nr:glycerophosphodiester phosphodiesterase family protein [Leptolyngbyaceae bacterium]